MSQKKPTSPLSELKPLQHQQHNNLAGCTSESETSNNCGLPLSWWRLFAVVRQLQRADDISPRPLNPKWKLRSPTSLVHQGNIYAAVIIHWWWRWYLYILSSSLLYPKVRAEGKPSAPIRRLNWGAAVGSTCWHPLGFTKTLIVHLEGGTYAETEDSFALPVGTRIISAIYLKPEQRNADLSGFRHRGGSVCREETTLRASGTLHWE